MPQAFTDTPKRDPYRNYNFKIKLGDRYVAGFSNIRALNQTEQASTRVEHSFPTLKPLRSPNVAIILERGVTHDLEFQEWVKKLCNVEAKSGNEVLKKLRRNLRIEVYNEAGQLAVSYTVRSCWVSDYQLATKLNTAGNTVAFQRLKLENEGWEQK